MDVLGAARSSTAFRQPESAAGRATGDGQPCHGVRMSSSARTRRNPAASVISMTIELKIPNVGESIQEVQIGRWLKKKGDTVAEDETLAELETDKASMDLPAPASGVLVEIRKQAGEAV